MRPTVSVSQTSVIFFALLVGFIIFITVRGELSSYLTVVGLNSGSLAAQKTLAGQLNDSLAPLGSITGGATTIQPGGIPR
jgi:hypothetical protein